jgi:hypothetical protein
VTYHAPLAVDSRRLDQEVWIMSFVLPRYLLSLVVLAGTAASQGFPSRADEVKRPGQEAPKEGRKPTAPEAKSIAEKAAHYESVHQERMARIRRLLAVYKEKGDRDKMTELHAMQDKLEKRHANAMQKFREQLGEERWAKVDRHIRGPSARALEVRNERANENAAERDARKAEGKIEKQGEERTKPEKEKEERSKEKPPPRNGGNR